MEFYKTTVKYRTFNPKMIQKDPRAMKIIFFSLPGYENPVLKKGIFKLFSIGKIQSDHTMWLGAILIFRSCGVTEYYIFFSVIFVIFSVLAGKLTFWLTAAKVLNLAPWTCGAFFIGILRAIIWYKFEVCSSTGSGDMDQNMCSEVSRKTCWMLKRHTIAKTGQKVKFTS